MRLIKILLFLAFYPSWSSTITAEENAKLVDELEKAQNEATKSSGDVLKNFNEMGPKLHRLMKAAGAVAKVAMAKIEPEPDINEIKENFTSSYTPGMVDEVLMALKTAGASSDDFLKDLNELGPKLGDFIKAAVPIGGLVSKKPESDEYKALKDFKDRSGAIWNDIRAQKPSKEFDSEVQLSISHITSLTDRYFHAPNNLKRVYGDNCRYRESAPQSILKYLKSHLITECGSSITTKEIEDTAKLRRNCKSILRRALRLFKVQKESTIPDPSEYVSRFMEFYNRIDKSFPIENMKVFKYRHSSYPDAIRQFFNEFPRRSTISHVPYFKDECLLRAPIIENRFNSTRIGLLVRKLHIQLIEIAFNSAICSNAMFSERLSMDVYVEEVAELATNITISTSKWLKESLAAAWPVIHNQIFQDQIESIVKQPGNFDRKMLIKAAEITNSILKQTGIPGYTYDMLIVKAPEKNFQFHFESLSNNFHFDKGDFGFNTVLVRRPFNYSNHRDQLTLEDKIRRLKIQIESEMKNLYDAKNVTEVAEGLKIKLGDFIFENGFKGFAIARKWEKNIFKSCSAIDDVQYSKDSFSSIYNFTYQNSGNLFQRCETFNFYFFLEDKNHPSADLKKMKSAIPMADKKKNRKPKTNENKTIFTSPMADEAVKALKAASESSRDPILDLRELGPKLANLTKAASPIGAIIVKNLNPEPKSEEYKVLMDFKTRSAGIWNNISAITSKPVGSLGDEELSKEYEEKVSLPIENIKYHTDIILNPEIRKREDFVDLFRLNLMFKASPPKEILQYYLESHLIRYCGASLTTEDVEKVAEDRAILMRVFRRLQVEDDDTIPDPSIYLSKFMEINRRLSQRFSMKEWIDSFFKNQKFPNYEEAIDKFFGKLKEFAIDSYSWRIEDGCILRALTIEKTFDYTRIGVFVRKLQNELIDLAFSSVISGHLIYRSDSVDEILLTKNLKNLLTWPLILLRLHRNGSMNLCYTYDVLIVKVPKKNFQFHIENLSNNHYFDEGDFVFNTVLVRRPFNYSNRMDQLNLQVKMHYFKIQIESEMEGLYGTHLADVVKRLKKKLGSFVTENGFRGFAIARKWKKNIFKSCSAIDDVQYSKDSFSSIYNFTYQNSGNMFQHCETFNFYFFL